MVEGYFSKKKRNTKIIKAALSLHIKTFLYVFLKHLLCKLAKDVEPNISAFVRVLSIKGG